MNAEPNYQWYTIHVTAGSEQRFAQDVIEKLERHQMAQALKETFIPYNEGQKHQTARKNLVKSTHMPGYIFFCLDYNPEVGHLILSCRPKGVKFLNCDVLGTPRPLMLEEIEKLKKSIAAINARSIKKITFELGETVRITEGTFASLEGIVESVDADTERLKVSISIFGQRQALLDLDFSGVEKVS